MNANSKVIYVCSPLSGDIEANMERARGYCRYVVDCGHFPLASHLLLPQFMDDDIPSERALAIELNAAALMKCDELWVFGEMISAGMSGEIDFATANGIPVSFVKIYGE